MDACVPVVDDTAAPSLECVFRKLMWIEGIELRSPWGARLRSPFKLLTSSHRIFSRASNISRNVVPSSWLSWRRNNLVFCVCAPHFISNGTSSPLLALMVLLLGLILHLEAILPLVVMVRPHPVLTYVEQMMTV